MKIPQTKKIIVALFLTVLVLIPVQGISQTNKVVVIPLGEKPLTSEQEEVLNFFSYDPVENRLTVAGTLESPIDEFRFIGMNVRGANQVRQDTRTNATNIPSNATLVEVEEETITFPKAFEPGTYAVIVSAFANFDTVGGVNCPCEFRGFLIQDDGTPNEVTSLPVHLEVEAGDDDIDATISHTFAFIATQQTQNYSFQVQMFAQAGPPAGDTYEVDEAGITVSTFSLANTSVLKPASDSPSNKNSPIEIKE